MTIILQPDPFRLQAAMDNVVMWSVTDRKNRELCYSCESRQSGPRSMNCP